MYVGIQPNLLRNNLNTRKYFRVVTQYQNDRKSQFLYSTYSVRFFTTKYILKGITIFSDNFREYFCYFKYKDKDKIKIQIVNYFYTFLRKISTILHCFLKKNIYNSKLVFITKPKYYRIFVKLFNALIMSHSKYLLNF